jgi:predicted ATPase/DNA-binding winged helix-turn-helix (wHTH) protein
MDHRSYRFGAFRLECGPVLLCDDEPVALGQRALALLALLVEHRGETVSKADIFAAVWPGLSVSEANLTSQIWGLRQALGDTTRPYQWIVSVSARGYRFVGPVSNGTDNMPRAAEGQRLGFPRPLTRLFGRADDLVTVRATLSRAGLVTLVGPGGIGKTRLALELALAARDDFPDGIIFIDLSVIRDSALAQQRIATALGIDLKGDLPPGEQIARRLKPRTMLIILDNCEHVLDSVAPLAELILQEHSPVRLLATSREAFACSGEQVYRLPLLPVPSGAVASAAEALSAASVALLVDRAQAADLHFALTDDLAEPAGAICRRLDGLPLALEMVGALAPSFGLRAIEHHLAKASRLPHSGSPTASPRHRSLDTLLDWSVALLSEAERTLFYRLSIFPAHFTLEAVEAVAAEDGADTLTALVRKSLVTINPTAEPARYRLLETIRTYARQILDASDELEAMRTRHARYLGQILTRARREWETASDRVFFDRYAPLIDDMRRALDWSLKTNSAISLGLVIVGQSWPLWPMANLVPEGRRWAEEAAAAMPEDTPDAIAAPVWFAVGSLTGERSFERATDTLRRAAEGFHRLGETALQGHALAGLGQVLALCGRAAEARQALDAAGIVLAPIRENRIHATYAISLGMLHSGTAAWAASRREYQHAADILQRVGADRMATAALYNLADAIWAEGRLDDAIEAMQVAVDYARRCGSMAFLGAAIGGLAAILIARGDFDDALVAAREAYPLCREDEYVDWLFDHLALRAAKLGRTNDAARLWGYAERNGQDRQPNEQTAIDALQALLRLNLTEEQIENLKDSGRHLSDEQATSLAFV